jgi:hypothetical protein
MISLAHAIGGLNVLFAFLLGWRLLENRADQRARNRLIELGYITGRRFDPSMIAELPEPARRYFNFTIQSGARLRMVVEIEMIGQLGLGTKKAPNYKQMQAHEILAPPHGLVWSLKSGSISGSDGALLDKSWTRFWLFGLIPIVRAGGADHRRSAFGRVVSEGAFWVPASLLPSEYVKWEALGKNSARAIVQDGSLTQSIDIHVDEDGAPRRVIIQRWSNENPEKEFREQAFGGDLSKFREFDGYRLPTKIDGGNHIGTPDYFPFFQANVSAIRFPTRSEPVSAVVPERLVDHLE